MATENLTAAYNYLTDDKTCECGHARKYHNRGGPGCLGKPEKGQASKPYLLADNHPLSPGKTIRVCACLRFTRAITDADWDAAEDAATYAREKGGE